MTLITFALEEEAAPFRRKAQSVPEVEILVTGIGRNNAERAVRNVLKCRTPICVLTCGYAGALSPELGIADLVYEADARSFLEPLMPDTGARAVRFHCANKVLTTMREKRAAHATTGAQAVDMESEFIRKICLEKAIPSATFRAISDRADEDMPLDFNALANADQSLSMGKLAMAILGKPACIAGLLRLRKHTRQAAEALAEGLLTIITAIRASSAK